MMQYSSAGMWGRGLYFAAKASYSHSYAYTIAGTYPAQPETTTTHLSVL
jgi:hypothetical protein